MLKLEHVHDVFLSHDAVDFRKGIDGLSLCVREFFEEDIFSGSLFVFRSKRRNRIKILYWERNGFCLWQKRVEKGRFYWPLHLGKAGREIKISGQQLKWLLEGFNLKHWRPHERLKYEKIM